MRIITIIAVLLDVLFFVVLLGPRSGEGMVRGWAEAFAMLGIAGAMLAILAGLVARQLWRRQPIDRPVALAMAACALPTLLVLAFNLVRNLFWTN